MDRPSSTLTRSPISKANTSATDKSTKDTVNKLQTSGARAPVSPRTATTTTTSRTGTLPLKKADAAKVSRFCILQLTCQHDSIKFKHREI